MTTKRPSAVPSAPNYQVPVSMHIYCAQLEAVVRSLQDDVATLNRRLEELAAMSARAGGTPSGATSSLRKRR